MLLLHWRTAQQHQYVLCPGTHASFVGGEVRRECCRIPWWHCCRRALQQLESVTWLVEQ